MKRIEYGELQVESIRDMPNEEEFNEDLDNSREISGETSQVILSYEQTDVFAGEDALDMLLEALE